jgi:sugar phosphate isomerase/epimerase
MNRREALQYMAGAVGSIGIAASNWAGGGESQRAGLGLVSYCLDRHRAALRQQTPPIDLADPSALVDFCRQLGAAGVQVAMPNCDEATAKSLRTKVDCYGMFLESMATLPANDSDLGRFEAQVSIAAAAGVKILRTVVLPGRRYEYFDSAEKFRTLDQQTRRSLERAAKVVEKHRVRLAVENHKTHLAAEQADLLKRIGSPYVGSCLDTGNNLALLEDPIEVLLTLAPTAFSVHLKDLAVQEYADGFLLADVPLGEGALDLPRTVTILRQAQPEVRFNLELLTREPLKVPCLTEKYWATFATRPGPELARTLRFVRAHVAKTLPQIDSLPLGEQVERETANIVQSLTYAREQLGL